MLISIISEQRAFFNFGLEAFFMIQNLTIDNFKALKHVEMKELANVNILLGKNNSGKTAVLEALLLFAIPYYPSFTLKTLDELNSLRGYKDDGDSGEKWDSLFYSLDNSEKILIRTEEEKKFKSLTIDPLTTHKIPESISNVGIIESSDFRGITNGLRFNLKLVNKLYNENENENKIDYDISYDISDQQIKNSQLYDPNNLTNDFIKEKAVAFVPARRITDFEKETIRFSQLEIENRHNEVVDILKTLEQNLKRLFVGINEKRRIIYGDIGMDRPIPLSLMGDGINHVLSIALTMVNNQNGLVLIDEIENGLHYSVLTDVWKMIFQTSKKLNVQVFATTHSDECLKAAYEAVESLKCNDCLKLYRFDKIKDGTRVEDYTAEELFYAITSNQEVR